MMSVYKAARISKPDACMAALPGTPGTMASMRDLKPWQNIHCSWVWSAYLGSYPGDSPGPAMVGRVHGKLMDFKSTEQGADPPGPVTWLGDAPYIRGKGHSRSTCFIQTGALAPSLADHHARCKADRI